MVEAEAARGPEAAGRAPVLPAPLLEFLDAVGDLVYLSRDALRYAVRRPPTGSLLLEQFEQIGWNSLSIVNLTALSTGMVLALQLGHSLDRFGAKPFVSHWERS